ncbi:hypothetical protein [Pseudooceanicola sp. MF1-13]|uniref:hypothetical protein n=1 Tax=Pseudooceanicola sp. MF1-13 TaxID=3379095 RepID=UPI003891C98F
MKRIAIASLSITPGAALAHGIHAPVPDHTVAHLGPIVGLAVILIAAAVAWRGVRG